MSAVETLMTAAALLVLLEHLALMLARELRVRSARRFLRRYGRPVLVPAA